jgi:hypothetical protein
MRFLLTAFTTACLLFSGASLSHGQSLTAEGITLASGTSGAPDRGEIVIENFDKDEALFQLNTVSDGQGNEGYLFGTGVFNFHVATAFTLPDDMELAELTGIDVYFAQVSDAPISENFTVEIVSGWPETGPEIGGELYAEDFPIASIDFGFGEPIPTHLTFANPVTVGQSFFVVFRFDMNDPMDELAIGSAGQMYPEEINNTWLFFNGTWHNVPNLITSQDVPLHTYLWVDARIDAPVSAEDGATQDAFAVDVFPNPSAGIARVGIEMPTSEHVSVTVVDMLGRTVAMLHDGPASGHLDLDVSGSDLASGIYLVNVQGETFHATRTFTVAR